MSTQMLNHKGETNRDQMIRFIVRAIRQLDDKKLKHIYLLVLHIQ